MSVSAHGVPVVLVGDPEVGSRTGAVGRAVAAGLTDPSASPEVVDLAVLGAGAIASGGEGVRRAREAVSGARLLVVATPVYNASYTGLLKLFLDTLESTALESAVAVPVVLAPSGADGASADLQLRPVLWAVGALLPVPSLVLEEHHLDHLPQYVDAWARRFLPSVSALAGTLRQEELFGQPVR